MANLKSLKLRISSVRSTQKITKAMKMVSAAKLKRARERAESCKPYAEAIENMLLNVAAGSSDEDKHPLMIGNGKDQTYLMVLITSDRGLCGGLNTALFRKFRAEVERLLREGKNVKIFCIGKKGLDLTKFLLKDRIIDSVVDIFKKKHISFDDANKQAIKIIDLYERGEFDICTVFYNKFISVISQKPTSTCIIPLNNIITDNPAAAAVTENIYEFEPGQKEILEELLPRNLAVQFLRAMLENSAGEHGARMSAMDNATRNAGEMIKKLNLKYNRSRQAAITSELIEIISGAEAI